VLGLLVLAYFIDVLLVVSASQFKVHGASFVALSLLLVFCLYIVSRAMISASFVFFITLAIYLIWAFLSGTVQASDFDFTYSKMASELLQHRNMEHLLGTINPPAIVYYASFLWLLGDSHVATFVGSAIAWAASAALFIRLLVNFGLPQRVAHTAGVLLGLAPGTIWYSSLVSPEAVFQLILMFSAFLLSIASLGYKQRALVGATGIMFGVLFATRPVGLFFYVAFLTYILTSDKFRAWRGRGLASGMSLAMGSFLIPIVVLGLANYSVSREFRLSSHSTGAWNFLNGTNFETKGMYSDADGELAGYIRAGRRLVGPKGEDAQSWKEADGKAIRIAFERIKDDPVRFLRFALSDKIDSMWGNDIQGLYWSLYASPERARFEKSGLYFVLEQVTNAFYVACLFLFVLAIPLIIVRCEPATVFLCAIPLLMLAALHVFIEVQNRYHIVFMPFIYAGVAWFLVSTRHTTVTTRATT
jgi:4-amino-4-deoxy-L-arabinose transferase-like glycosyltransferase